MQYPNLVGLCNVIAKSECQWHCTEVSKSLCFILMWCFPDDRGQNQLKVTGWVSLCPFFEHQGFCYRQHIQSQEQTVVWCSGIWKVLEKKNCTSVKEHFAGSSWCLFHDIKKFCLRHWLPPGQSLMCQQFWSRKPLFSEVWLLLEMKNGTPVLRQHDAYELSVCWFQTMKD